MGLITLQSDFGTRDAFAAILRGVIAGIAPDARVIDLSHAVPPYDIRQAAINWIGAAPYFPPGTIHVAVIDPEVGSDRRILAASLAHQLWLCPDNGLLTPLLRAHGGAAAIHEVTNTHWMRPEPHPTFHGRDIFAPVAAHLSLGKPLAQVGPPAGAIVEGDWPVVRIEPGQVAGEIVHFDHFGNAWTNIPRGALAEAGIDASAARIRCGALELQGVQTHYAAQAIGTPVVVVNSVEWLEIGVVQGSAQERWSLALGDPVTVSAT